MTIDRGSLIHIATHCYLIKPIDDSNPFSCTYFLSLIIWQGSPRKIIYSRFLRHLRIVEDICICCMLNSKPRPLDYVTEVIVEETNNSSALDIDFSESILFWTAGAKEEIRSAKLREGAALAEEKTTVLSYGVHSPDGLAVDWLVRHIYWTDTGHDTISVVNCQGTRVRTLIDDQLDDPRAIALDPEYEYMYWTDWGQSPKIERCGMDSNNRQVIVLKSMD